MIIRGSKRQRAVHREHWRITNIGACAMRRVSRSGFMVLDRSCPCVVVVLVPGGTGMHAMDACDAGVIRCCVIAVKDCRHCGRGQCLPRQHHNQQHYRKHACSHRHGANYNIRRACITLRPVSRDMDIV
jgi:hypothetical protein